MPDDPTPSAPPLAAAPLLSRFGLMQVQAHNDLARLASYILGTPLALICTVAGENESFTAAVDYAVPPDDLESLSALLPVGDGAGAEIADLAADTRLAAHPLVAGAPRVRFAAWVPLATDTSDVKGSLAVFGPRPLALSDDQRAALTILARQIMVNLELRAAAHSLERQVDAYRQELARVEQEAHAASTTDRLTGIRNRAAFDTILATTLASAGREQIPVSLLLIDVDHFKGYNDTFGHSAGDDVLRAVAGLLTRAARRTDTVARYGGEEFALILPGTDSAGALLVAERIRRMVAAFAWTKRRVTVSIGVSTAHDQSSAVDLVDAADSALYDAKWHGRNQVIAG